MTTKISTSTEIKFSDALNNQVNKISASATTLKVDQLRSGTGRVVFWDSSTKEVLAKEAVFVSQENAGDIQNCTSITGLSDPTEDTQAASKGYVDRLTAGLSWKQSVVAFSSGNIASLAGAQLIDNVVCGAGDRVLLAGQTNAVENGIYVVSNSVWSRADDMKTASNAAGMGVFVREGNIYEDSAWICSTDTGSDTVGTHSLTFTQFSTGSFGVGGGLERIGKNIHVDNTVLRTSGDRTLTGKTTLNDAKIVELEASGSTPLANHVLAANTVTADKATLKWLPNTISGKALGTDLASHSIASGSAKISITNTLTPYNGSTNVTHSIDLGTIQVSDISNHTDLVLTTATSTSFSAATPSTSKTTGTLVCAGGLGIGGDVFAHTLRAEHDEDASSTTTGAIRTAGGISCEKKLHVGGAATVVGALGSNTLATTSTVDCGGALNVDGAVNFKDTTQSTSATTGSLIVDGGVGIAGNLFIGGSFNLGGTFGVGSLNASAAVTIGTTLGVTGDATLSAGLAVGALSQLASVTTSSSLQVGTTLAVSGMANFNNTTDASNFASGGSVTIDGGCAIAKKAYVGSNLYVQGLSSVAALSASGVVTLNNNTPSTSPTTGALKIVGGVGIALDLHVAGSISCDTISSANGLVVEGLELKDGGINCPTNGLVINAGTAGDCKLILSADTDNNDEADNPMIEFRSDNQAAHGAVYLDDDELVLASTSTAAVNLARLKFFTNDQAGSDGAGTANTNVYSGTLAMEIDGAQQVRVTKNTESSSISTGSFVCAGGAGFAKNLFIGGTVDIAENLRTTGLIYCSGALFADGLVQFNNTTQSTSIVTGAVKMSGGAAIKKNLYVGGIINSEANIHATTTLSSGGSAMIGDKCLVESTTVAGDAGTDSAALVVKGGALIWENLTVSEKIRGWSGLSVANNQGANSTWTTGYVDFYDKMTLSTNWVRLKAPENMSATYNLKLSNTEGILMANTGNAHSLLVGDATAIGNGSSATGTDGTALGKNAYASGNYAIAINAVASGSNSIAIGTGATAATNACVLNNSGSALSAASSGFYVANITDATSAANAGGLLVYNSTTKQVCRVAPPITDGLHLTCTAAGVFSWSTLGGGQGDLVARTLDITGETPQVGQILAVVSVNGDVATIGWRDDQTGVSGTGAVTAETTVIEKLDVTGSTPVAGHVPYAASVSGDVATLGWASTHKTGMLYARGIQKIGSANLDMSTSNEKITWAGSPPVSTGAGSGNWNLSGVFSNGSAANSEFKVSVGGLYEVHATMQVWAADGEERYVFMQLLDASNIVDGTTGLLCGMQVVKQADSSASSHAQVHLHGVVTLAANTDYVFVARSESDGTAKVYGFSGCNSLIIKPLL